MSHRENNLDVFVVEIIEDMVTIFDSDYNGDNGDDSFEHWEQGTEDGIPLAIEQGFNCEAERFIKDIYDNTDDDVSNITSIMNKVISCWGSEVSQYKFAITPTDVSGTKYIISVSYLS
jgi:hypothetical protein